MSEWNRIKLGDISDLCLGKMLDKEKNKGEFQPYLANINVRWGSFDFSDLKLMRFEESESDRYGLQFGDIVICEGGEPGRCAIWKEEIPNMKIQKALHRVRIKGDFSNQFVYYRFLLAGRNGELRNYFIGSTIKHLTGIALKEIEFSYPTFIEQQKIASVLSALDAKIELNNRINAELEATAKTLYDYWFVQFDFPDENGKPYKSSGGKMVWNDELKRDIPDGWEVGDIARIVSNIKDIEEVKKNLDLPYVPIDNLPMKKLISAEFRPNDEAKSSLVLFKKYDILLGAMRVYFHRVCLAIQDGITRTTVFVLRPKETYLRYYSLFTINTDSSIAFATVNSKGSTMPYTFWENGYEKFGLVIPPKELLLSFNKIIEPILEQSIVDEKENQQLSTLRDWLLPMLMNGQVKVKMSDTL